MTGLGTGLCITDGVPGKMPAPIFTLRAVSPLLPLYSN